MKVYSTGDAAGLLGTTTNRIQSYARNPDFPEPKGKIGGIRAFTESEIMALYLYLKNKKVNVSEPKFPVLS